MFNHKKTCFFFFWFMDAFAFSIHHPNHDREHLSATLPANFLRNRMHQNQVSFILSDSGKRPRDKRGIVLIDEDFDKLPDDGVRQGWSGGSPDPEGTDITKELSFIEEGSGESTLLPESSTNKPGSTLKLTVTPSELQRSTEIVLTMLTEKILEGSGDTDFSSTSTTTAKELDMTDYSISTCMNYTCDDKDLSILPGFTETIAEDTSLILMCLTNNPTNGDLLRWYRSNESDSFLLESSSNKKELKLAVQDARSSDSGTYICVRHSHQSCCHRKLNLTVHRKPSYKYHLLTVGLVVAVSLFTCLLLSIHRRYKIKQFKKETKTQIQLNEFLL